jgi:hypothetical protein
MHNGVTRRTFLAALSASAAGVLTGGLAELIGAAPPSCSYGVASEQQRGNIFVGRGSFGQPAGFWSDAADGREDLGLAA